MFAYVSSVTQEYRFTGVLYRFGEDNFDFVNRCDLRISLVRFLCDGLTVLLLLSTYHLVLVRALCCTHHLGLGNRAPASVVVSCVRMGKHELDRSSVSQRGRDKGIKSVHYEELDRPRESTAQAHVCLSDSHSRPPAKRTTQDDEKTRRRFSRVSTGQSRFRERSLRVSDSLTRRRAHHTIHCSTSHALDAKSTTHCLRSFANSTNSHTAKS